MKLVTTQIKINDVAKRWRERYFYTAKGWTPWHAGDSEVIYQRLLSLPENATANDVNSIIGNDSWITLKCDECKQEVEAVVMLGDEPDFESSTAFICLNCLKNATQLIEEAKAAGL